MFVLTFDQRRSTGAPDRVPEAVAALSAVAAPSQERSALVLPIERTVGDEAQALLDDASTTVALVLELARHGGWSIGLGIGGVRTPLGASTRASTGDAYVRAREAVERAKSRGPSVPLAVEGPDPDAAREVEALLRLLAVVVGRRTARGWEAVDGLLEHGGRQTDVARALGISEQAVSQRLRTGLWAEETAARPVVERLLTEADR
ncbi:hypothetical protein GCM10025865_29790 [Paraoerskovia sediminicola]|uniref:SatD family (SatD) n=1 Tax=Paraoerskovia sediminicola TaxID=1138587 RepID=A0ABN6XJ85_9CELL|nr:hypothetical protein [Paraoerskovia sediminicola]BDZ43680.1 hypothetical protein GCM10025865_29790 [Paraoerskovia sediminicola]